MSFFQKNTITSIFHYFPKCGTFFLILLSIFLFNTQVSFADFDITEEQCVAIGTSSGTGTSACEWTSCNTDNGTQAYVGRCYQESKQFCCLTYTSGTTPSPDTCKNKLGGTCSGKAECPSKQLQIGTCSADGKDFCCKNTDPDPNDTPATSISSFKYTPLEPIPGAEGIDGSTLAGFLQSLYVFALWSAGVMAMFMIGIGGFWYLTSAGSTARVASAKTIITNALVGLLVLMFTWLILYVINPDLTKLDWTSLEMLSIGTSMSTYRGGPGSGNSGGSGGPGNGQCEEITTGHCSVEELKKSCFQRFEGQNPNIYTQASQICNVESRGNINSKSDVDKCKDGTPFSYGLFQINFTYHCPGGMAGGKNSSCTGTGPNYASCMSNYTGESGWANNIQKACDLYAGRGWGDWKNTREKCGF